MGLSRFQGQLNVSYCQFKGWAEANMAIGFLFFYCTYMHWFYRQKLTLPLVRTGFLTPILYVCTTVIAVEAALTPPFSIATSGTANICRMSFHNIFTRSSDAGNIVFRPAARMITQGSPITSPESYIQMQQSIYRVIKTTARYTSRVCSCNYIVSKRVLMNHKLTTL